MNAASSRLALTHPRNCTDTAISNNRTGRIHPSPDSATNNTSVVTANGYPSRTFPDIRLGDRRWQVSWLTGHSPNCSAFPVSQWRMEHELADHSCGGSLEFDPLFEDAPSSLLDPFGYHQLAKLSQNLLGGKRRRKMQRRLWGLVGGYFRIDAQFPKTGLDHSDLSVAVKQSMMPGIGSIAIKGIIFAE